MNKIAFYKERSFGDKFNVIFEFIKQNWRPIFRYVSYGAMPLSLLGALSLSVLLGNMAQMASESASDMAQIYPFFASYLAVVVTASLATWWVATVMYTLMQVYNERKEGLEGVTFPYLKPLFKHNAWRVFKLAMVLAILITIYIVLAVASSFIHWALCTLLFLGLFALLIPLLLVSPVYMYEPVGIWPALQRGIRLGWKTWGGIFGLGFVTALMASVVQGIVALPWQVCNFVKMIFWADYSAVFVHSVWFNLISYVTSCVMIYAQFLCSCLFFVCISYLYSHAAEKIEGKSIEEGICRFDDMADRNEDPEITDFDKM